MAVYGKIIKISLISMLVIILTGLYLYGTIQHLKKVNLGRALSNQNAYIDIAKEMHETKHLYLGDRNRMPLYPFLQSLFYSGEVDEKFFIKGKYINVILSILILFSLFFIFKKYFNLFYTVNLLLITAFSVFMFKAAYFQCEILFYFLNFISFLLMWKMLVKPSVKWGIITGVVAGLAYLTKPSVLPGLMLFVLFSISQLSYKVFRIFKKSGIYAWGEYKEKIFSQLLCIIFVISAFIGTTFFYLQDTKRVFGRYFYNVNSTFYMWCDSWQEAKNLTPVYGDRNEWPDMPAYLIPGPEKYLREHSIKQMAERVGNGLFILMKNSCRSYGYCKYCFIYFAFFLFLSLAARRGGYNRRQPVHYSSSSLFCLFYFIGYLFLSAWYAPIAKGNRLILAYFLPFMFIISVSIMQNAKDLFFRFRNSEIKILTFFNFAVLIIFTFDLYFLLRRAGFMYAGG